ncbi:MAG: PilT/PilU family type 4a pilus ATPase [Candidatus Sumerlaeia bacterium]|nr:PilT/PilU family type 4a pilus ATPase [Candidatus Sumerlaeia bacterium]
MINFKALFGGAVQNNASDIHIMEGSPPYFRLRGDLKRVEMPPLTHKDMHELLKEIMPEFLRHSLEEHRGVDCSYQLGNTGRFRVVVYYQSGKLCATLRSIPVQIPSIDELQLPPVLKKIALYHRGMVLVTGITGSGKSTTLASMINELNNTEARRIITIEDPIEYRYLTKKCIVSQREVGSDVGDFTTALRQSLRADPDVILVGEMRDAETIRIAIKAAETGHLLFSTLHTTGAVHTIQRIIGNFRHEEHTLLREQLSLNLRAAITQRLVKTADGKGRCAALEILVITTVAAKLILENRAADLGPLMGSRDEGMQTMDQGLADLVRSKRITMDEASRYCNDFYALKRFVAGIVSSGDSGGIIG